MYAEKITKAASGWLALAINVLLYIITVLVFIQGVRAGSGWTIFGASALTLVAVLLTIGFFIVNPNESAVLLLFGSYKGTVKTNGFWWANPFYTKIKISLRVHNLNTEKLKVNDKDGNPIEIAAVVVWQVQNTAQAQFDVEDYRDYVEIQSESAVRKLASAYSYDSGVDEDDLEVVTLRGATDEINQHLQEELQERLARAGVRVVEARLSHLAYAPEIAADMLRRQQANAIVAARKRIVEGAVGMVEMALKELERVDEVELDQDRKAAMISNLLVVLCSETSAQPVVNTGTLYQ
jgi:regulator of protease activity HflC (stomatin/prohibitin superfamily)